MDDNKRERERTYGEDYTSTRKRKTGITGRTGIDSDDSDDDGPTQYNAAPTRTLDSDAPAGSLDSDARARLPCHWGPECRRKNPTHFVKFSHPGDPDWREPRSRSEKRKSESIQEKDKIEKEEKKLRKISTALPDTTAPAPTSSAAAASKIIPIEPKSEDEKDIASTNWNKIFSQGVNLFLKKAEFTETFYLKPTDPQLSSEQNPCCYKRIDVYPDGNCLYHAFVFALFKNKTGKYSDIDTTNLDIEQNSARKLLKEIIEEAQKNMTRDDIRKYVPSFIRTIMKDSIESQRLGIIDESQRLGIIDELNKVGLIDELENRLSNGDWGQEPELLLLEAIYQVNIRVLFVDKKPENSFWRNERHKIDDPNVITLLNRSNVHYEFLIYNCDEPLDPVNCWYTQMFADVLSSPTASSAPVLTAPAAVASIDPEEEPYDMASGINPITEVKAGYKTYYISGIFGCYLMEGETLKVDRLKNENYTSYDNLKRGFFPMLQTHNNTMNDKRYHQYTYYVEIENINDKNEYWSYNLSDAHLINGFVHTIVEEGEKYVFDVKKNELKVNTSLLKPRNEKENIKYVVLPVKSEIYNNWWKTGIFERTESVSRIKISDTEYDKLHFKINNFRDIKYCGDTGCKIYKNSVKQYWEQYSESLLESDSISAELYHRYSEKIFETQQKYPEYEPTESVDQVAYTKFDSIIQEIYDRKLPELISHEFRKKSLYGNAINEAENLGFDLTKPDMPYIKIPVASAAASADTSDQTLADKLVGISTTADILKTHQLMCVCYGSQIIPYGNFNFSQGQKLTKNKNRSSVYKPVDSSNLRIEVEHIAHFLQMMLFGGSYHNNWEESIYENMTLSEISYIKEGFYQIKQIRELLYDISIAIFNQWKGHKNVIDFRVEIDINDELKINVIYNENVMNKILYQTYLNKNYINGVLEEWDGGTDRTKMDDDREKNLGKTQGLDEDGSKLKSIKELIEIGKKKVYCVNSGNIIEITIFNLEQITKDNIRHTHTQMKERVEKLNRLFNGFDCEKLLLITLTGFQKMLNEFISKHYIPDEIKEKSQILQYKFKEALKGKATASGTQAGGNLNEGIIESPHDLVKAYYYIYDQFNNDKMIDMLENIFNIFYKSDEDLEIPQKMEGVSENLLASTQLELTDLSNSPTEYKDKRDSSNFYTPRNRTVSLMAVEQGGGNSEEDLVTSLQTLDLNEPTEIEDLSPNWIEDLPKEVTDIVEGYLDFEDCEDLRNYCELRPKTCASDTIFKTKYKKELDYCKAESSVIKSLERFQNMVPLYTSYTEAMTTHNVDREGSDSAITTILDSTIIGEGFVAGLLVNQMRDIFKKLKKILSEHHKKQFDVHDITLMELCYYFLNKPDELYDILHHWFIFILDKQDRLFAAIEDNYGKYPEPVTENWPWYKYGNYRPDSDWLYSKWLFTSSNTDILLLQKTVIDMMYEYLKTGNPKMYGNQSGGKKEFLYNPDNPKKSFDVYIDKNPKDTIPIKYKTLKDVKDTIKKLEKLYKDKKYTHKRIWQVAMIMKVRLEVLKDTKPKQFKLSEKYLNHLSKRTKLNLEDRYKFKFKI